jgi:molybdate transport system substrate-binding protein
MRHVLIAAALAVLVPLSAEATEITVFAPGITTAGIRKLANEWTIETGNRVNIIGGTVGAVKDDVSSGMPGDIVMLPGEEMKAVAAKLKPGTTAPVGRILFGLIVKAGAPHPDISTVRKFAAALKASSGVGFNDPATQSLGGQLVAAMLAKSEFKGVIGVPLKQNSTSGVADGIVPMAGGTRSEQLGNPSIELVGLFPDALKMHIDISAAVLADSKAQAAADEFVHFIARPEAAMAWNDCGVVAPSLKGQPAMGSCYEPLPTMALSPSNDEARAPRPARARGIPAVLAIEGAQTAIATCLLTNYKVTALIVDAAGVPIAMISGDGAAAVTQRIAMGKAQTVIKYKMTSGAGSDPAFMAELAADPLVGPPRQGAVPIMVRGEMIGAFAVSGAPGGDRDEPCAISGLARIQNRLQ